VNLFIADDVGLGKTIEAMLIARELLYRKKVKEIVVACPPSMQPQWQDELENRFGLAFVILDKEYIRDEVGVLAIRDRLVRWPRCHAEQAERATARTARRAPRPSPSKTMTGSLHPSLQNPF
jgi:SNF2 family DNA or RNA helicase